MMAANGLPRSKGAVLLAAIVERQHDVAKKIGVRNRALISQWRNGDKKPSLPNRRQLLARFEIPIEAWDEPPASPSRWGEASALGQAEVLEGVCAQTRAQLVSDATMTPLERLKVGSALARLETDLRRLKGEDLMPESDVLRHPKWLELKATILGVLERHPAALREVVAALERQEGQ